ncbi:MAG: phosphatase PAP2 family protein [Vicinamibacterales bacterium]|nr:phosphatase PAP2 family protein [Vicinamibacterales bacterium]
MRSFITCLWLCAVALCPGQAVAQAAATQTDDASVRFVLRSIGRDLLKFPSSDTVVALAVGGGVAIAGHPSDASLVRRAAGSADLGSFLRVGAAAGSGWVQVGGALGTWAVGAVAHSRKVQRLGADLVRAQALNLIVTDGLKAVVRRRRPAGGPFSFPSGHTSATIATAAVLQRHVGLAASVPVFALAGYVAASRVQGRHHYPSDVLFGAAIGLASGRTVTLGRGRHRVVVLPSLTPDAFMLILVPRRGTGRG